MLLEREKIIGIFFLNKSFNLPPNPMLLVLVMTINPSNIACNNLVGCVIKLRPNCLLIREPIKRGKDPQMCHKKTSFYLPCPPKMQHDPSTKTRSDFLAFS